LNTLAVLRPMFARCSRASPKRTLVGVLPSKPSGCIRLNSSAPERTRKLPNTGDSFLSRVVYRWLLSPWFLTGVVSGVVLNEYLRRQKNGSFITFSLTGKDRVSSTASIFHLEPKQQSANLDAYREIWKRGIWNVQFKQPQLQIVRAYTPLPPYDEKTVKETETGALRFLVRHDPYGEVSNYLHRLPMKSEIDMRGPYLEYEITDDVRQVVFFAGGTGIAPALQVAHALFEGGSPGQGQQRTDRKLHILWANRTREDCLGGVSDGPPAGALPPKPTWSGLFSGSKPKPPPQSVADKGVIVRELEALKQKYPGQITVEYFVNAEDTWINENAVLTALSRFEATTSSTNRDKAVPERHILISGPPGFIAHLAGPKEWRNGREEQGALGRILAHSLSKIPHDVKVWKI
jgi:hypothetical protein